MLTFTRDLKCPYTMNYLYKSTSAEMIGFANLYPETFSTDSYPSFYSWNGISSVKDLAEKDCALAINRVLLNIESNIFKGTPYSIADLGFAKLA